MRIVTALGETRDKTGMLTLNPCSQLRFFRNERQIGEECLVKRGERRAKLIENPDYRVRASTSFHQDFQKGRRRGGREKRWNTGRNVTFKMFKMMRNPVRSSRKHHLDIASGKTAGGENWKKSESGEGEQAEKQWDRPGQPHTAFGQGSRWTAERG